MNLALLSRVSHFSDELSCIDIEVELKKRLLYGILIHLKIEVLVIILWVDLFTLTEIETDVIPDLSKIPHDYSH